MGNKKIKGLYIVVFDNGIKIGISDDIKTRLDYYKSPWSRPIREIYYMRCQYPRSVENKLKEYFKRDINSKGSSEFITNVAPEVIVKYALSYCSAKPIGTYTDKRIKPELKHIFLMPPLPEQIIPELPKENHISKREQYISKAFHRIVR